MDNGVTQSQRCALRQPDHAVLGCVIDGPARNADETANRRIVYDCPATLFSHLEQLVFHAEKDTAEIDRIHSVEFFASGISSFNGGALHTGIVERRIQTPKC